MLQTAFNQTMGTLSPFGFGTLTVLSDFVNCSSGFKGAGFPGSVALLLELMSIPAERRDSVGQLRTPLQNSAAPFVEDLVLAATRS